MLTNLPLQWAIGALATKSVGSLYRIHDVREAPLAVQEAAKRRESVIMTSAALFSLGVTWIVTRPWLKALYQRHPVGKYESLVQSGLTVLALLGGESLGRYVMPPLDWHGVTTKTVNNKAIEKEPLAMAGVPMARFNIPTVTVNPSFNHMDKRHPFGASSSAQPKFSGIKQPTVMLYGQVSYGESPLKQATGLNFLA
ncbi:MAG: hypothetical protein VKJ04_02605 [Vampirovibrionales bacterium]|nr:hypothetical protein [Vampirovibrionales bacterium]